MVLTLAFLLFVGVPLGMLAVSVGRTITSSPSAQAGGETSSVPSSVSGRPVIPVGSSQRSVVLPTAAPVSAGDVIAFRGRPGMPVDEPRSHTG
jgi:hypothetical protein